MHRLKKRIPSWLKELEANEHIKREAIIYEELYYDDESRYGAYVCQEDERYYYVINGTFPFRLKKDITYTIEGKVALYKEGKQIKVCSIRLTRALSLEGIVLLLQSLDGLDKRAHAIVERYKSDTIELLKQSPHRVAEEISGISLKQAEQWSRQLDALGGNAELLARLQSWGISLNASKKLIAELGNEVDGLIMQNPYLLSKVVRGYGFRRCDVIAMELGLDMSSLSRQLAAIAYVLREASYDGHCYLQRNLLLDRLKSTLDLPETVLSNSTTGGISFSRAELDKLLTQCIQQGKLMEEEDRIYLPKLYRAELKVAAQILRLLLHPAITFPSAQSELESYLARKGLKLEKKQHQAVTSFSGQSGGMYILNGSAGCGKTFTLNIILDILEQQYTSLGLPFEVRLFAPTGKAAKVAAKATGRECTTIHRGLSYNPQEGFQFNEKNPLPVDCVVIDESSMLDIMLASQLFSALPKHCKVILLGDTKQLPSIGAGNVLGDLIASEVIPVVTLDVVKRQGKDSGIVANATKIIAGEIPAAEAETSDAFIIRQPDAARAHIMLLRSIQRLMNARGLSIQDIQVLCPQRKGEGGTYVLNWLIQQHFNGKQDGLRIENCKFTKIGTDGEAADQAVESQQLTLYFTRGDKVIHTVNNYSKVWYMKDDNGDYVENKELLGITNGECGVVEEIYLEATEQGEEPVVVVRYEDGYVKYSEGLDELDHCYAMTVHKSQGSQWKAVIMIVLDEHRHMLNNSIFYTGYTRAQQFVCVIGQDLAIRHAITNFNHTERNCSLQQRFHASAG